MPKLVTLEVDLRHDGETVLDHNAYAVLDMLRYSGLLENNLEVPKRGVERITYKVPSERVSEIIARWNSYGFKATRP